MRLTEIYIFQCGDGDLYAFSVDKTGCNLPASACKAGWLPRGQLSPSELIDAQYAEAITAISEQGFSILKRPPRGRRRAERLETCSPRISLSRCPAHLPERQSTSRRSSSRRGLRSMIGPR
jgi:hypothetical protein